MSLANSEHCFRRVVTFLVASVVCRQMHAQSAPRAALESRVVPFFGLTVGGGVHHSSGPQLHGGLHVDMFAEKRVFPTLEGSGWVTLAACTNEDPSPVTVQKCASSGWRLISRINGVAFDPRTARVRPYGGLGAGITSIGSASVSVHSRLGVVMGSPTGVGLDIAWTYERLLDAPREDISLLTFGLSVPLRKGSSTTP